MELKLPYAGTCELTSRFGWRNLNGADDYHSGIDLCGVGDKRILSPCAGVVGSSAIVTDHADRTWEWGNYVRIDTPDGLQVYLCHMAARNVEVGRCVEAGDVIGIEGSTGYSIGQHCHMEVRKNGKAFDPTPLLGIPNAWGYYSNADLAEADAALIPPESVEKSQQDAAKTQRDNTPDDYAKDAVDWAQNNRILLGTADGNLKLHEPVTRQDLLVILYRAR